jgi:Ca2+-binding EF-hand superfamily protein
MISGRKIEDLVTAI